MLALVRAGSRAVFALGRQVFIVLAATCALSVLLHFPRSSSSLTSPSFNAGYPHSFNSFDHATSASTIQKRITLIALWNNDKFAPYLPALFSSAVANSDAVDLLWVNIRSSDRACVNVDHLLVGSTNIRALCINWEERATLTANYLCGASGWDCTPTQYEKVWEHFSTRNDGLNVDTKPMRGSIYRKWIDTEWWAWLDVDQVIGDFAALWPWETVNRFDFATIAENTWQNLYLRGQFTAFRFSDKLDQIWKSFEPLSSAEKVSNFPRGSPDEWEWSDLYMNEFKSLNWIMFPRALGADRFEKTRNKAVMSGKKAFYVPGDMSRREIALLFDDHAGYTPRSERIFAAVEPFDPDRNAVPARELKQSQGDTLWDKELDSNCGWRESRCIVTRDLYFHRSVPMRWNGQMLEYFDRRPVARPFDYGWQGIEEKILQHHKSNKKEKWFGMPSGGIQKGIILEMGWPYVVAYGDSDLQTTFAAHPSDFEPEGLHEHGPYGQQWAGFGRPLNQYPLGYPGISS